LELKVPSEVTVQRVESVNGAVEVRYMSILHRAETVNGAVKVEISALDGDVNIESVNGKLDVFIIPTLDAILEIDTVNGDVALNDLPLYQTQSNPIIGTLGDGSIDIIYITTVNSDIDLHALT
jgi:DUF4097 and DUF4098 domain-containing protein YvlB